MEPKKNILVTGGAGFIGKHLVKALKALGHKVYVFDLTLGHDLMQRSSFESFLDKKIDIVFHLAGRTFVPKSWEQAELFYQTNVLGTQNVLSFCQKANAKLVYMSAYVYGIPKYLPIDEKHPVLSNNPYAHSKLMGEELCRFYAREMGIKVIVFRPFNIYGLGQNENFLIPMLLKQLKEKSAITVRDASPKRDFLYIDDFISACLKVINYEGAFTILNVGSGQVLSVKQIIEAMISIAGKSIAWQSLDQKRKNEIPETKADCTEIKKALGWEPRVDFKVGLTKMMRGE